MIFLCLSLRYLLFTLRGVALPCADMSWALTYFVFGLGANYIL